jgi:hypothetical protein
VVLLLKSLEVHQVRYASYTSESLATCVSPQNLGFICLFGFRHFVSVVDSAPTGSIHKSYQEDQHTTWIIPNNRNSVRVKPSQLPDIQNIIIGSVKNEEWVRSRICVQQTRPEYT